MKAALLVFALAIAAPAGAQPAAVAPDGISQTLRELERILQTADADAYAAILAPDAETSEEFLNDWLQPGITRTVIQERLRAELPDLPRGEGYDVYVDALTEMGRTGRAGTMLIKVVRNAEKPGGWRVARLTVLTTVHGLYRLYLNPDKQYTVTNLALSVEDFELRVPAGAAFVAETDAGVTGIVILGRGEMVFTPAPDAEKGQVRIYAGAESLATRFNWVYLRAHPSEFDKRIDVTAFHARDVDLRELRRADAVFQENLPRSFGIELADLSRDRWSVIPKFGDMVAEMDTARGQLAYMRSLNDAEDIRFIDRTRRRTIALYPSREKLATRGPFFSEDDSSDFDILNYDIEASLDPRREWIDGRATLLLTARRSPVSTLILTLAEPLTVRSVMSRRHGHLMALRVSGQDDIIVNLPEPLTPDAAIDIELVYSGRLSAVPPEREAVDVAPPGPAQANEFFAVQATPSYIYTGRSGWYPQGEVTDYATATLTLRVPDNFSTIASGTRDEGYPRPWTEDGRIGWTEYRFSATQPVRYLGWATSRFVRVESGSVAIEPAEEAETPMAGVAYNFGEVVVESSGMLQRRGRDLFADSQRIVKFFGTIVGDIPYPTFTLALVEREQPGGHSPPYFAALSQPPPATPISWRTDPAYFDNFPEFFLAHEAAHQWWGQAVGWKNYHEQWISEGFAQYFAALYAEHAKRENIFRQIIAQLARWTLERSDQGPVYLGYRLGHIRNDGRVFRALVYNKGALALHMLRRLIGDDAFFRGVRRFYSAWRFQKAGTEDVKAAFEAEANRDLDLYFSRWIYEAELPRVRFSYTTEPGAVVVRLEQVGAKFEYPVTVSVRQQTSSVEVTVPVVEQITTHRIPINGVIRNVGINEDGATPVVLVR